jgi:hypothetical protein
MSSISGCIASHAAEGGRQRQRLKHIAQHILQHMLRRCARHASRRRLFIRLASLLR